MENRRGCSFKSEEFGIYKMPTVLRTVKGDARRQDQADARNGRTPSRPRPTKKTKLVPPSMAKSHSEGLSVVPILEKERAGVKSASVVTAVSPVRDFPQPFDQDSTFAAVTSTGLMTTSKAIPTSDGNKSRGKSLVLFLEDVISFETALNDPDRSTTSLRNAQGELRTIIARESGMLEMMRVAVVQRAAIMEDLISRLEVDLRLCSTQAFAPTRDRRPVIEVQQRPLLVSDEGEFDEGGQDEEDG
jgi:hypothetical protein